MSESAAPSPMRTSAFRTRLLSWYSAHARKLPWRENRDPYRVWLSEIMLQQTRIAAVIEHYHEFLRRFPTVEKLAAAREASVLAVWSGLGYYRRARMLHVAAKVIVRELGGRFPTTAEQWRTLPGIGRYTSAAIASIAFGEPVAVVDGNVERVLQRISGHRRAGEELWSAANQLLDRKHPGDFNQAMMELGATVCTPRAPACLICPVMKLCTTRGEMPKSPRSLRQTKWEIHYALDCRDDAIFLVQRPHNARLMAGMWELPEAKAAPAANMEKQVPRRSAPRNDNRRSISGNDKRGSHGNDKPGSNRQLLFTLRHSITVTDYTVHVWRCSAPPSAHGRWIAVHRLGRIPLTGLTRKILRKAGVVAGRGSQV